MNDKKTLSYYRDRFATFLVDEEKGEELAKQKYTLTENTVTIGVVTCKTTRGKVITMDIDLHSRLRHHTAFMAVTTRGEYILSLTPEWLDSGHLTAVIAHELGHLVCKHLERGGSRELDRNTEKALRYYDYIKLDGVVGEEYVKRRQDYMRAVFFGLERGGVLMCELEADVAGSRWVGSDAMVAAHLYNLKLLVERRAGIAVTAELINRVSRLRRLGIKPQSDFQLELYI